MSMLNGNGGQKDESQDEDFKLVRTYGIEAFLKQGELADGSMCVQLKIRTAHGPMVFLFEPVGAELLFNSGMQIARLTKAGLKLPVGWKPQILEG